MSDIVPQADEHPHVRKCSSLLFITGSLSSLFCYDIFPKNQNKTVDLLVQPLKSATENVAFKKESTCLPEESKKSVAMLDFVA